MKKKNGFSLIEMLFVVAMFGIILFLAISFGTGNAPKWKLSNITSRFVSSYMLAKQEAAKRNTFIKIEFITNGNRGKSYKLSFYDISSQTPSWKELKYIREDEDFFNKNDVTDFCISSKGTIYDTSLNPLNSQIILLFTIRKNYTSSFRKKITIYPYGGIKIER